MGGLWVCTGGCSENWGVSLTEEGGLWLNLRDTMKEPLYIILPLSGPTVGQKRPKN